MFAYPAELPLVEIKNVIMIAKSGDPWGQKQLLLHDAWVVQGYAQKMVVGEPAGFRPQAAGADDPVVVMEKLVADAESGVVTSQAAIPWALIAKFAIELLMKVLS